MTDNRVFHNKYVDGLWKVLEFLCFTVGYVFILCRVITEWGNYGKEDPIWWLILLVLIIACKTPMFPEWFKSKEKEVKKK